MPFPLHAFPDKRYACSHMLCLPACLQPLYTCYCLYTCCCIYTCYCLYTSTASTLATAPTASILATASNHSTQKLQVATLPEHDSTRLNATVARESSSEREGVRSKTKGQCACCSVLQCVCCGVLQYVCYDMYVVVCCTRPVGAHVRGGCAGACIALYCSVFQYVVVCCSVRQCVAVSNTIPVRAHGQQECRGRCEPHQQGAARQF